jgi:NitT/TauT family transport system permease protein
MKRAFDAMLVVAVLAVLWQLLAWIVGDAALVGPWESATHLLAQFERPRFRLHLIESITAFAQALAIAWLGGVGIGVALGAHRLAGDVAEPMLAALYALPKVTLYPLILLIFGLGMSAKVAFGAIHGVLPVAIFALNAVRNIRPVHRKTAAALRLNPYTTATRIFIPAMLPEIVSGLRLGFSLTLLGVLIGEMFASQRGLGFMIMNAINLVDVRTMLAVSLLLFIFAAIANALLLAIERRLHRA